MQAGTITEAEHLSSCWTCSGDGESVNLSVLEGGSFPEHKQKLIFEQSPLSEGKSMCMVRFYEAL